MHGRERMRIAHHAREAPDWPAMVQTATGEALTRLELHQRPNRLARLLHARGLRRGDVVGVPMGIATATPVVEPAPATEPSAALAEEVVAFGRQRVARGMVARSVESAGALPRMPRGKIQKRVLQDRHPDDRRPAPPASLASRRSRCRSSTTT